MIVQKSAATACHSSAHGIFSPLSALAITSPCRSRGRTTTLNHPARGLASAASTRAERSRPQSSGSSSGDDSPWPKSPNPTPYEIFDQARGAPYCKQRFLRLVKQYHPDRHHHTAHDGIPHVTKLERYRLVVAANDILSDPARRRLYDTFGSGWEAYDGRPDTLRSADHAWRRQPGNASMNATWEDWERWYQERDGKKQEPIFVSNAGFVGLIALFALIGGWGHITRAGTNAAKLVDIRDEQHASASKVMRQRQSQSAGLNKDERVRFFLQQREGWGYESPPVGHAPPDLRETKG
ncbi:hypothetical protein QBC34DRAFT_413088 [Podospora aff. communis PSN243]|uniref:J domain-containing protein n=1 Tax=Podospora aff. communis PSN243 TaxID=3040156 RepID=A0AAV9GBM3_9PEZI|nr:hypothetical protein QBC34DRAFT_413088 [Podospora aff. communis PSN243]